MEALKKQVTYVFYTCTFYSTLLSFSTAHQARARLRERHRDNLRKKLEMLKAEQGVKEEDEDEDEDEEEEEEEEQQEQPKRTERVEERPVVTVKEEVPDEEEER